MQSAAWRNRKTGSRAVTLALLSALLASCTSATDPSVTLDIPSYSPSQEVGPAAVAQAPVAFPPPAAPGSMPAPALADSATAPDAATLSTAAPAPDAALAVDADATAADPQALPLPAASDGDVPLPAAVAYLPQSNPAAPALAAADTGTAPTLGAPASTLDAQLVAVGSAATEGDAPQVAPVPVPRPDEKAEETAPAATEVAMLDPQPESQPDQVFENVTEAEALPAAPPKKKSLLASLFGSSPTPPKPIVGDSAAKPLIAKPQKTVIDTDSTKPIVEVSNAPARPVVMASLGNSDALPGVRQTALFEIKRKSGVDDDSDVDVHEDEDGGSIQLASAAGLARLAPNGLLKQTDRVDVSCLKPSLVRVLKTIEQHYGRPIVVTSGYRSPSHNRRARGAKNSLHMFCAAADIQVAGVAKWDLANYARSMQGRGGVGTYCNTDSVHVDVGPERDWNWRCRRRK